MFRGKEIRVHAQRMCRRIFTAHIGDISREFALQQVATTLLNQMAMFTLGFNKSAVGGKDLLLRDETSAVVRIHQIRKPHHVFWCVIHGRTADQEPLQVLRGPRPDEKLCALRGCEQMHVVDDAQGGVFQIGFRHKRRESRVIEKSVLLGNQNLDLLRHLLFRHAGAQSRIHRAQQSVAMTGLHRHLLEHAVLKKLVAKSFLPLARGHHENGATVTQLFRDADGGAGFSRSCAVIEQQTVVRRIFREKLAHKELMWRKNEFLLGTRGGLEVVLGYPGFGVLKLLVSRQVKGKVGIVERRKHMTRFLRDFIRMALVFLVFHKLLLSQKFIGGCGHVAQDIV